MAKVTTKADLTEGTEYDISLGSKTITINIAGNITGGSNNGVAGLALYSSIADFWKSDATANRYQFPFYIVDGISGTALELRDGWEFANTSSIALVRDMGFAYKDTSGVITAEYANFVQAGSIENVADQPYYLLGSDTTPSNFGVTGTFNESIQIYGDASHGNFNKRSAVKFYVRDAGDTYAFYDLATEQSLSSITYRSYLAPMSTVSDSALSVTSPSGSPYSGMTLTLGATTNTINSTSYDFAEGEIDANGGTDQQVYDWFQDLLLQTTDIDSGAGTQRGDTYGGGSLTFVGGIITTSQGLTIKNIAAADESNIIHVDDTGTGRQETFIPSITVNCVDSAGASTSFATGSRLQLYNASAAAASAWATGTAYSVGDMVLRTTGTGTENGGLGLWMECTTAGTSHATTEPTWDTTIGNTTTDNTVTWTTQAIELKNAAVTGTSDATTYASGANAAATIRYRINSVDGSTGATTDLVGTLTASTANVSASITQTTESVYVTYGTDGTTVTNFSADYTNTEVDVDVASDFALADFYSWWVANRNTADGIRYFFGGITATDTANLVINNSVVDVNFDNSTTTNVEQTDNIRIAREDGAYPVTNPTSGGGYVVVNYFGQVFIAETGVSGLTAGESSKLLSLNTAAETADAVWDEATSGHTTAGTTGKELSDAKTNAANAFAVSA